MERSSQKEVKKADDEVSPIQEELGKINEEISNRENALSLDTMLTVLDGMIEMRGRVIIATTNFIDNIDKALMRDGRFDIKIKLDTFNSDEIRELLRIMFAKKASDAEMRRLETIKLTEDVYTPTQLINIGISQGSLTKVLDIIKLPEKEQ
jgi:chaperone BCS1